jgi:hypothetical protein
MSCVVKTPAFDCHFASSLVNAFAHVTPRMNTKRLSGRVTASEIDDLLAVLVEMPTYEARVLHTSGRPATRSYFLRPN